jgi:hypothetical protein
MQIMGLSNAAFWLSWIITYVIMLLFAAGLMTLVLLPVFPYVPHSSIYNGEDQEHQNKLNHTFSVTIVTFIATIIRW